MRLTADRYTLFIFSLPILARPGSLNYKKLSAEEAKCQLRKSLQF